MIFGCKIFASTIWTKSRQTNVTIPNIGPPYADAYFATLTSDNIAPTYGTKLKTADISPKTTPYFIPNI